MSAAIPVNIITGALGVGKTTAIARLLASKPSAERWVVILNEFTDSGIDALTLAAAAAGAYDVRAIPGGCLCCTGEEDFQRQLRALVEERPARILIEPSGIAHPGAVIDELRAYERTGALQLLSTVALIDAPRLHAVVSLERTAEREQVEAADVLLLSKAELATAAELEHFKQAAGVLFPPKRWIGVSVRGELPATALHPPAAMHSFEFLPPASDGSVLRQHVHVHVHDSAPRIASREFPVGKHVVRAKIHCLLGRTACGWEFPAEAVFTKQCAAELMRSPLLAGVERFKAVLRTGMERRVLLQRYLEQFSENEIAWRRESRIEVQMRPGVEADWAAWDRWWTAAVE